MQMFSMRNEICSPPNAAPLDEKEEEEGFEEEDEDDEEAEGDIIEDEENAAEEEKDEEEEDEEEGGTEDAATPEKAVGLIIALTFGDSKGHTSCLVFFSTFIITAFLNFRPPFLPGRLPPFPTALLSTDWLSLESSRSASLLSLSLSICEIERDSILDNIDLAALADCSVIALISGLGGIEGMERRIDLPG
jgi:hypothetical protein